MKNDKNLSVSAETAETPKDGEAKQVDGLDLKIKRVRVTSKVKAGAQTWSGGCGCFSSWEV